MRSSRLRKEKGALDMSYQNIFKLIILFYAVGFGSSIPLQGIQNLGGTIQCNPGSGNFVLDGATLPCEEGGVKYCDTIIGPEDVQFCFKNCCSEDKKDLGPSDQPPVDPWWGELSTPTNSSGPTPFERDFKVNHEDPGEVVSVTYRTLAIVGMVVLAISLATNIFQCLRNKKKKIDARQYETVLQTATDPHPPNPPIAVSRNGRRDTAV